MTSKFVGKWELESSEGFDDFLKAMGVGYVKRKMAGAIKPVMTISNEGQNWNIKITLAGLKNIDSIFTENVPFFESNPLDEKKLKAVVRPDGPDRQTQESRDPDTNAIITSGSREIVNDKLVQTINAGNVKCVRVFRRAN